MLARVTVELDTYGHHLDTSIDYEERNSLKESDLVNNNDHKDK